MDTEKRNRLYNKIASAYYPYKDDKAIVLLGAVMAVIGPVTDLPEDFKKSEDPKLYEGIIRIIEKEKDNQRELLYDRSEIYDNKKYVILKNSDNQECILAHTLYNTFAKRGRKFTSTGKNRPVLCFENDELIGILAPVRRNENEQ